MIARDRFRLARDPGRRQLWQDLAQRVSRLKQLARFRLCLHQRMGQVSRVLDELPCYASCAPARSPS